MKKVLMFTLLLTLMSVGIAQAEPNFTYLKLRVDRGGCFTATLKEADLPSGQAVTIQFAADVEADWQCVTARGQCPPTPTKTITYGTAFQEGTFTAARNGYLTATLKLCPPAPVLGCPDDQHMAVSSVRYTNISLVDITNGVTTEFPFVDQQSTLFICP